jgi:hypothetical protein
VRASVGHISSEKQTPATLAGFFISGGNAFVCAAFRRGGTNAMPAWRGRPNTLDGAPSAARQGFTSRINNAQARAE